MYRLQGYKKANKEDPGQVPLKRSKGIQRYRLSKKQFLKQTMIRDSLKHKFFTGPQSIKYSGFGPRKAFTEQSTDSFSVF